MSLERSGVVFLTAQFTLEAAHGDEKDSTYDQECAHDIGCDIVSSHNEKSSTKEIEPAPALCMLNKAEVIPHQADIAERKDNQNTKQTIKET